MPVVKNPSDCLALELDSFYELAVRSGEVTPDGLKGRIMRAKKLAFVRCDEKIVGIAALKCPGEGYRKALFTKSESKLGSKDFPYELGWVYVEKKFRRKGHSQRLVQGLLSVCEDQNIYATSREKNDAMRSTLKKFGFTKVGNPWPSKESSDENLLLFVRRVV